MNPKVSILMSTRNRAHFIKNAIDSVLAQTFKDWELVVVDDGSTDETNKTVTDYCRRDSRIRYVYVPRAGLAETRVLSLTLAGGRYITFLDDDDTFYPDKLAKQVNYLEKNPQTAMVYSAVDRIYENGAPANAWPVKPARTFIELIRQCTIQPNAMLAKKSVVTAVGGFDPKISTANDYDLWLRIAREHKIDFLPMKAGAYYWHSRNISHNQRKRCWNYLKVYKKLLRLNLNDEVRKEITRGVIEVAYLSAEECLKKKAYIDAAVYFGMAISFNFRIGLEISWSRFDNGIYKFLRPYFAVVYCCFACIFLRPGRRSAA